MIRARAGHGQLRPARLLFSMVAAVAMVAGCVGGSSTESGTDTPGATSSAVAPTATDEPTTTPNGEPTPTDDPATPTPAPGSATPGTEAACSGDDNNRAFFHQAAAAMSWPVYCAVLGEGWFLEDGHYRLANGGDLDVTYRGPGDVHVAIVEGAVCSGMDVDTCAPRDAVIGPAAFADREGELGQLATSLVLDVDRGATPTWRATGLGVSEADFRAICAAMLLVED